MFLFYKNSFLNLQSLYWWFQAIQMIEDNLLYLKSSDGGLLLHLQNAFIATSTLVFDWITEACSLTKLTKNDALQGKKQCPASRVAIRAAMRHLIRVLPKNSLFIPFGMSKFWLGKVYWIKLKQLSKTWRKKHKWRVSISRQQTECIHLPSFPSDWVNIARKKHLKKQVQVSIRKAETALLTFCPQTHQSFLHLLYHLLKHPLLRRFFLTTLF